MIAESTKDNLRALYRTAMLAGTSLALDVLIVPVVTFCKARLGIVQEVATEEIPVEAPSASAQQAAFFRRTQKPPHFVGMCLVPTAVGGKTICQLRRYDNNEWLWSSRPYKNPAHASRDARRTIQRFGWECLGDAHPEGVIDGDTDRSEEAAEAQRTFASIINVIVKADKDEIVPCDAVDSIAHILKRDQGLLGHRVTGVSRGKCEEHAMEKYKRPLTAIAEWVREAKEGKEAFGDALGEIAVILEKELGFDQCALWPEGNPQFSEPTREVLWRQVEGYRMVYASLLEWFKRELAVAKTLNKSGGPIERAMSYLKIIHQREMDDLHEELEEKVAERPISSVQGAIMERAATYENAARAAWSDNCRVERKTGP